VLREIAVVVEESATSRPRAPELPVLFVAHAVLLKIVHVFGAEVAVLPIAVVVVLRVEAPVFVEEWFTRKTFVAFVALEGPDVEVNLVFVRLQVR
jgi:hypothetical protein